MEHNERLEIGSQKHSKLIFNKEAKAIQRRKKKYEITGQPQAKKENYNLVI